MGNFFNDIGKAVTRMLSPSQRQVEALQAFSPLAMGAIGAATGNMQLAATGAAFGGVGDQFDAATGMGRSAMLADMQHSIAMQQLAAGQPVTQQITGGIMGFGGVPNIPGLPMSGNAGGGDATMWILGLGAVGVAIYFLAGSN